MSAPVVPLSTSANNVQRFPVRSSNGTIHMVSISKLKRIADKKQKIKELEADNSRLVEELEGAKELNAIYGRDYERITDENSHLKMMLANLTAENEKLKKEKVAAVVQHADDLAAITFELARVNGKNQKLLGAIEGIKQDITTGYQLFDSASQKAIEIQNILLSKN